MVAGVIPGFAAVKQDEKLRAAEKQLQQKPSTKDQAAA